MQPGPHHTWRLPKSGAVAKVWSPGTTTEAALRETRIAQWLLRCGIQAPRPVGTRAFPLVHIARYYLQVTFAEDLGRHPPGPADLAAVLRHLHRLDVPANLGLAKFAPLTALSRRLRDLPAGTLSPDHDRRLRVLMAETRTAWRATSWGSLCVIHGDATPSNCIVTPRGPALIDFEGTAIGPREWDLAAPGWSRDVYGTPAGAYDEFTAVYGQDITAHDDGRTYRDVLTPVFAISAWLYLAEYSRTEPDLRPEADRRLRTLLADPLPPFPWNWRPAARAKAEAAK
ncbi:phosphotransferase family protein [Kitasatospora sp. NPDC058032]|uniref:phosphotransferase family protein n=1 Tax=Kitasatospora sp. NPDC058032 TaxID=3346307 RepID=UPI0036DDD662